MTRRIAMLSVHACPLAKLGGRDSGGMNVYVRELARELGKRGVEVDVFTRWREKDDPRIQPLGENARVIHLASGPMGYWPKMDVYEHLDEFTTKLQEWEHFYNFERPHGALAGQTPYERLRQATQTSV